MDRAEEGRVIERAVAEMRRQQVPVTPGRVEQVVNNCQKKPKPTLGQQFDTMGRQLDTALAAVQKIAPREPTLTEIAQQEVKRHPTVAFFVNEEAGTVSACIEPATNGPDGGGRYDDLAVDQPIPMSDFRRNQLQQQLDAQERIAADPQSSVTARKSAALAAGRLRKLLSTVAPGPVPQKETGTTRRGVEGV
jgi:hypothetical protein